MLLKCCTHYVSKFGKLNSGHRTGKAQSSFQSQMRAIPKNIQTIPQLHLFHMLARLCSKFFKLGFSNTWTVNSLMFKLVLKKAEEPEIKLPTSAGSSKKARKFQKNIYFCFIGYAKAFDFDLSQHTVENSERDGNTRPPDLPLEKPICRSGSNS